MKFPQHFIPRTSLWVALLIVGCGTALKAQQAPSFSYSNGSVSGPSQVNNGQTGAFSATFSVTINAPAGSSYTVGIDMGRANNSSSPSAYQSNTFAVTATVPAGQNSVTVTATVTNVSVVVTTGFSYVNAQPTVTPANNTTTNATANSTGVASKSVEVKDNGGGDEEEQ